ncbi:MAG: hypothetical protein ACTHQE_09520 [Thermomicrobiales bacterium]
MMLDKAAIRAALGNDPRAIDYPQLVAGSYEDLTRQARFTSAGYREQFPQPIALWQQALGIYSLVVTGHEPLLRDAETPPGRLRVAVVTHGVGAAKAGLDLLLDEHFTLAFHAIGQLVDVVVQHQYLGLHPEDAVNWPRPFGGVAVAVDAPSSRAMIGVLKRHAIHGGDEQFPDADYWQGLDDRRRVLSGLILPDLDPGVTPVQVLAAPPSDRVTVAQRLVVLGLYYGLVALADVLDMLKDEYGLGTPLDPSYWDYIHEMEEWIRSLRPPG